MARRKKIPPIHPGEILQEEFLVAFGITQYRLAKDTSVPPRRINEIVRGQRSISADTALRLALRSKANWKEIVQLARGKISNGAPFASGGNS